MPQLTSRFGRLALALTSFTGLAISFAIIFWFVKSGDISDETGSIVSKQLLNIYVPLLGIMAGFYFSGLSTSTQNNQNACLETFLFAFICVFAWAFIPPALLMYCDTVDAALSVIDSLAMFGQTLSSAAITFYFSKVR